MACLKSRLLTNSVHSSSKTALTETLEIDQYMWAILNTLSGNQEVEEVVIDSLANWTPVRANGIVGNSSNPMDNSLNSGGNGLPVPAIKVSVTKYFPYLNNVHDATPFPV